MKPRGPGAGLCKGDSVTPFICGSSLAAPVPQEWHRVVVTESAWLTKPGILVIWPFAEKVCQTEVCAVYAQLTSL